MNSNTKILLGLGLLACTACTTTTKTDQDTDKDTTIVVNQPASPVIVEERVVEEPAQPATTNAISSKQVSDGTINVTKVNVLGSIMTVELMLDNPEKNAININFPADNIYYIDDATAKKNSLLKDDAGKVMLTPTNSEGKKMRYLGSDKMVLMSLKFAAPPAESKTISLTLGDYGTFDGLPITRQ
ncbi:MULTISPECIES: hypothetical protein [Sphingobacterium]|uniref:DUF4352 domain-containing protein n=1 Tax=Sphingobacterium tenebrionis TaxID=3111775 RepID=A0ABU8I3Y9_9SPHI|nr:hypothetical protein [Sphingobacterium sp. CZ-2]QBR11980.1 hypothetical protein E3D81_07305 [Sphingobacterium sp. CZ-2]